MANDIPTFTHKEEDFLESIYDYYGYYTSLDDILYIISLHENTEFCHKMNGDPNDFIFYRRLECKINRLKRRLNENSIRCQS